MNDIRDDIREVLQRKAAQVPPHLMAPPSLARRARGRIFVNALTVGLTLTVLSGAALAGVRTFGAARHEQVAGQPTPPPHGTPSGAARPACTSGQLRAVGTFEGAAGSLEGGVTLSNFSDTTCTLRGRPIVVLLHKNLKPITSGVTFLQAPPGWLVDGSPRPAGWPVVTIHPGDAAFVRIRWSNWCPDGRPAPLWRLGIPGSGSVDVTNGFDELPPPPCNGADQPSTVEVGPFEPVAGP
jgi:Domain of unknown function (DUF4232)